MLAPPHQARLPIGATVPFASQRDDLRLERLLDNLETQRDQGLDHGYFAIEIAGAGHRAERLGADHFRLALALNADDSLHEVASFFDVVGVWTTITALHQIGAASSIFN